MKNKNKKGFTLVELIIVITILAVLATIAFVSFQSYTKDARNSKRLNDLTSISRAMEIKLSEGVDIMNFANGTANKIAGTELLAGSTVTLAGAKYTAGDVNSTLIGVTNNNAFLDPTKNVIYKIGVTSLAGGTYELASINEKDTTTAMILGTFKTRSGSTAAGTISSATNGTITLTSGFGTFRVGDILKGSTAATGVITEISKDLTTIKTTGTIALASTSFTLGTTGGAETLGLVGTSAGAVVTNGGTNLHY
ncbi:MAG: prepilin-type N-terminal cleavage/methylation domain-containing protein [Candidatus Gracilibacteria bacterium]|nr:prepilin-type N-terminal cleavage/methylation domain-containing protein [Candidatus Gracilibacteria bacterium]